MNTAQSIFRNSQKSINNGQKPIAKNLQSKTLSSANPRTKFWGVWLPVPTVLAVVNSLFWTWLILSTVGYSESAIENAGAVIIDQF